MTQPLRLLHISDRSSGFAADTLRGLTDRHGMDVLSIDIRAFSSQNIYDPLGFVELDRKEWLELNDPGAFQRFQWADVLFVESSQFALSWVSRSGFDKPVLARIALDDCDRPGLFLVDWTRVSHVVFPDTLSRSRFAAVLPDQLTRLSWSVTPLHLDEGRIEERTPAPLTIRIVGDPMTEAGAMTGLALQDQMSAKGVAARLVLDPVGVPGATSAGRKATLISERAARARPSIGGQVVLAGPSGMGEPAPGYVLCAAGSLSASSAVAIRAAGGARPVLRRGHTCAQDWFGDQALVYDEPGDAAVKIIEAEPASVNSRDALRNRVREVNGIAALASLAAQIRKVAGRSKGGALIDFKQLRNAAWRLTTFIHDAIHRRSSQLRRWGA